MGLPKDVANVVLFQLKEREDGVLKFQGGDHYAKCYMSKVLKNPNSGTEICFVIYDGVRIMLEATEYIVGGKCITDRKWNSAHAQDGRTLRQIIADDAKRYRRKLDVKKDNL